MKSSSLLSFQAFIFFVQEGEIYAALWNHFCLLISLFILWTSMPYIQRSGDASALILYA